MAIYIFKETMSVAEMLRVSSHQTDILLSSLSFRSQTSRPLLLSFVFLVCKEMSRVSPGGDHRDWRACDSVLGRRGRRAGRGAGGRGRLDQDNTPTHLTCPPTSTNSTTLQTRRVEPSYILSKLYTFHFTWERPTEGF